MNFKVITPILNAVLVVACVIHIGINAYYELFPDIPSVKEYETYLGNVDFPVSFKICLKEIFAINKRYIKYGYANHRDFFYGKSKIRKDFVGWNGDFKNKSSVTVKGIFSNPKS